MSRSRRLRRGLDRLNHPQSEADPEEKDQPVREAQFPFWVDPLSRDPVSDEPPLLFDAILNAHSGQIPAAR
jgi:hypothetical protein